MKILNDEKKLDFLLEKYQFDRYFTDLSSIRAGIKLIKLPKNTLIYSLEEHKKYVYFLLSGELNIYANIPNGKSMLVQYCNDFVFIGDMELMGYSDPSNTIHTKSECLCIGIDLIAMKSSLLNDNKFILFLCKGLAEKLADLSALQRSKQLYLAKHNIAEYIIAASEKELYFKENLREVAPIFGISYRHLHRILSNFVDNNILRRTNGGYEIIDMAELRSIANPDN